MGQTIGVYGTGAIGTGLATLLIGNSCQTVVVGHSQAGMEGCLRGIGRNWDDLIAGGYMTEENKRAALALVTVTDDPARLQDCSVVFEAVTESLLVKGQVYERIEQHCGRDTIIASCTSSLDADILADLIRHKERFLIAHPFQPVHLQPLVELVRCAQTEGPVVDRMKRLLDSLHRQTVVLHKSLPGFLVNRFAQALFRESLFLMEEGVVSAEDIDRAVKYAVGMRYASIGLLEYFDAVGFELERSIAENVYPSLCSTTQVQATVLEGLRVGAVGQKTDKGLYTWTEESRADFRRRLQEPFASLAKEWDVP